jgi:CRISPR/Cas system-associated exonuclease Cas4 (RecB family)
VEVQGSSQKAAVLYERNASDRALSPTAVNTWLQCSLRFYFRYVLQLPEPDEMKDEIDSPVFGSIFHEVIEKIYRPWVGKTIGKQDIEGIIKDKAGLENEIRLAIGKHFFRQKEGEVKPIRIEGKTLLIYANINTFLRRLLQVDSRMAPFELISLEKNYQFELNVNLNGRTLPVRIGGTIDRVDRINGSLRIVDYKTGNVEAFSFEELDELFERNREKPPKEILQALIYCLAYKRSTGERGDLHPAIYSLRKLFEDAFSPEIQQNGGEVSFLSLENDFTGQLQDLVSEIFSGSTRYVQTPHIQVCQYCPYREICQRHSK